jgi:uncharacterized protein
MMSAIDTKATHERLLGAFATGDLATVADCLADDVMWHLPGNSRVAGEHKGKAAVLEFLGNAVAISEGTFRLDLIDAAYSDSRAYAWQRITAQREGVTDLDELEVVIFEIRDSKVVDVVHRPEVAKLDAFYA